jgi:hypothetical protein
MIELAMFASANNPFLQGKGKLSTAAAAGHSGSHLVQMARGMSKAEWLEEMQSLQERVGDA